MIDHIIECKKNIDTLQREYVAALNAAVQNSESAKTAGTPLPSNCFDFAHEIGTGFFNACEQIIWLEGGYGIYAQSIPYTYRVEESAAILDLIANHHTVLRNLGTTDRTPTETAFSLMQRLVKSGMPEKAKELREQFVELGLPTAGFDTGWLHFGRPNPFNVAPL